MTPSVEARRLRALAQELLPSLSKSGESVAIIGSVARGNATSASDLDLWVLGKRSGRELKTVQGATVTLTRQTLDEALAFENLCRFEVDDLLLLDDRSGAFEKVRTTWKSQRRRIRAEVIRASQRQIELDLDRGSAGSDRHRATFLRLACWRLLCLRVFIDHGWRVPRLHALEAALPKPLVKRLHEVLDLPSAKQGAKAVALMPAVVREAKQHVPLTGYTLPEGITAKSTAAPREAAYLARRELISELLPAVFHTWGITDVRGIELLGKQAPNAKKAFELLEGTVQRGTVKKLEAHLAAIERALGY